MSENISVREAARRLGVSDTAVHKAIKAGRVTIAARTPNSDRPLLAWPAVRDQWLSNSDGSKRSHVGGEPTSGRRVAAAAASAPRVELPVSSSGAGPATVASEVVPSLRPSPRATVPVADDAGVEANRGGGPSYAQSRAMREAYQARLAKLDFDEKSGKLVNIDALRVEAFKVHRRVRDMILNIPDRCAPALSSMNDAAEIHAYLLGEITECLRSLSADIYRPGGDAK